MGINTHTTDGGQLKRDRVAVKDALSNPSMSKITNPIFGLGPDPNSAIILCPSRLSTKGGGRNSKL